MNEVIVNIFCVFFSLILIFSPVYVLLTRKKRRVTREDTGQRYMYQFELKGEKYTCYSDYKYDYHLDLLYSCSFVHFEDAPDFIYGIHYIINKLTHKNDPEIMIQISRKIDMAFLRVDRSKGAVTKEGLKRAWDEMNASKESKIINKGKCSDSVTFAPIR